MGGWEKIVPRFASALDPDNGELLLWAGDEMENVIGRKVWQRFELTHRHSLPGRERSWIWKFRRG
jgi:hypothetical protein